MGITAATWGRHWAVLLRDPETQEFIDRDPHLHEMNIGAWFNLVAPSIDLKIAMIERARQSAWGVELGTSSDPDVIQLTWTGTPDLETLASLGLKIQEILTEFGAQITSFSVGDD